MNTTTFENPKTAEFEAEYTDRVAFEDADSGHYVVLTKEEATKRIGTALSEGKYDLAKKYSEMLLKKPKFDLAERSKSVRISFSQHVVLIREAYSNGMALNDVVTKRVAADLQGVIPKLSKRTDINAEKLSVLKEAFNNWRKKPEKKTHTKKGDEPEDSLLELYDIEPEKTYELDFYLLDQPPIKELVETLVELEVKKHSKLIPREAMMQLFKVAEPYLNGDTIYERPAVELMIARGQADSLDLTMRLNTNFTIEGPVEDRLKETDPRTLSQIRSLMNGELSDGDTSYFDAQADILHATLLFKPNGIYVQGININEREEVIRKHLSDTLINPSAERVLKDKAMEALNKNDMAGVAEFTRRLQTLKRDWKVQSFAIDTIADVVKRSQVVSFRAPDVVIRAWEAFGDTSLGGKSTMEPAQGEQN